MKILAVDTSTTSGSVALLSDASVLWETVVNSGLTHSETLLPALNEAMKHSALDWSEIDCFAVTTGPGSFTGLRIGISVVKGLALSTQRPVVSVSSLEALAWNLSGCPHLICPFLDAKRGQVYTALFRSELDGGPPERLRDDTVEDPRNVLARLASDKVILMGDGTRTFAPLLDEILGGHYTVAPPHQQLIRASSVGLIALEKCRRGELVDNLTFVPVYIRASEVERGGRLS